MFPINVQMQNQLNSALDWLNWLFILFIYEYFTKFPYIQVVNSMNPEDISARWSIRNSSFTNKIQQVHRIYVNNYHSLTP